MVRTGGLAEPLSLEQSCVLKSQFASLRTANLSVGY